MHSPEQPIFKGHCPDCGCALYWNPLTEKLERSGEDTDCLCHVEEDDEEERSNGD